jgi:hypothetical protein
MKTKIFGFLVIVVFLLNLGLAVEAKPEPIIDKLVFIHREKTPQVLAEMSAKAASSDKALYKWSGLHWDTLSINYFVNINAPGLDTTTAFDKIKQSFETWDDVTSKEIFATATLSSTTFAGTQNNMNDVSFGSLIQGTIAVTFIWYNRSTKAVVEVDTIFNTYYQWSTSESGVAGKMDLQNIATHEFGHWLVLDDLYTRPSSQQTMYGYSDYGETIKRDLASGDIAGILKIYPS